MRTHAHTLVQLCASSWVWSLVVWAAPLDHLPKEHRGTVEIPLPGEGPLGGIVMPQGGSFMVSELDGSYRFGLQSEDQWRMESRNPEGVVEGRYVYQNPEGQTVDISYNAGPQGFIAEGDAIPGGRAPLVDAPVDDDANHVLQENQRVIEEVKDVPYTAVPVNDNSDPQSVVVRADKNPVVTYNVPYGALALIGIPQFEPVYPSAGQPYGILRVFGVNPIQEDLEAQAIIVSVEPYQTRDNLEQNIFDDSIYGPTHLDGVKLPPGFIEV